MYSVKSCLYPNCFPPQPLPLQPQTRLQWRRCADLPVEMESAQAVLVGGKVCVGGGDAVGNSHLLFQYDRRKDGWATLPPCPVGWFGLGQFKGHIITVGGCARGRDTTNKLHRYKEASQTWEEYLRPMPTPRRYLSVITTQSAIIACGGVDSKGQVCATVEVYTDEPSRWYTADRGREGSTCTYISQGNIHDVLMVQHSFHTPSDPGE